MDTRENLECQALLAASGEARLNDDERRRTDAWTRDLGALTLAAREAFADRRQTAAPALNPAARQALARRRLCFRRRRHIRSLAAAAALALLAGGGLLLHAARRRQTRLERLDSVLFLIGMAEAPEDGGLIAASPVTLEALADQLRQLQFVSD